MAERDEGPNRVREALEGSVARHVADELAGVWEAKDSRTVAPARPSTSSTNWGALNSSSLVSTSVGGRPSVLATNCHWSGHSQLLAPDALSEEAWIERRQAAGRAKMRAGEPSVEALAEEEPRCRIVS